MQKNIYFKDDNQNSLCVFPKDKKKRKNFIRIAGHGLDKLPAPRFWNRCSKCDYKNSNYITETSLSRFTRWTEVKGYVNTVQSSRLHSVFVLVEKVKVTGGENK